MATKIHNSHPVRMFILFAVATMFVATQSLANDMRHVPPADLDEIIVQAPVNITGRAFDLMVNVPIFGTTSTQGFDKRVGDAHFAISLEQTSRNLADDNWRYIPKTARSVIVRVILQDQQHEYSLPEAVLTLLPYPRLDDLALFSEIGGDGNVNAVSAQLSFGTHEEVASCAAKLEGTPGPRERLFYVGPSLTLVMTLDFDGIGSFELRHMTECHEEYRHYERAVRRLNLSSHKRNNFLPEQLRSGAPE